MKASGKRDEKIQTIMFLRHGVAKHNLPDPVTGASPNLRSPTLWDPPLVTQGMKQALSVRERLADGPLQSVDLIIASPLTRCLQTAHLVFFPPGTSSYDKDPIPLTCMEQVREAYGMHYPDKRRDKSLLEKHWPFVHFDPSMTDRDEQWSETRRETIDDVVQRVTQFLDWVAKREETNICVVSHGVWIEACFQAYFPMMLENGRRVYNCDFFQGQLVSQNGKFVRLQNLGRI
ncbi:phosphoglycerate mutase [Seminavis robusta]|uniref:Phosphoglycerate mutase n=1 Tax=Seminavis robusta TaxID=568900 RepID=A0A9N8HDA1_9STRA|nr:phosphoglycerate mutase [Seminavis robusta]|eukprot:Sro352_g124120.1 phosphoglycerate mutase (232) ;mRNA; r:10648-11343